MSKLFPLLLVFVFFSCSKEPEKIAPDLVTPFEKSKGKKTATYKEIIAYYTTLDKEFQSINVEEFGITDSGKPLTLVTYSANGATANAFNQTLGNLKIFINNGIHPGEPDGIDATMMLMRDLATGKIKAPDNVWIAAIAVYNIGGALNRNSTSRTNQNGPESYGFRGNARNYDLNRDFIKADTENARTFANIFHTLDPDIFIDNHVSNGADYQYTLTHLFTQHNKLGGDLGTYIHDKLQPQLEDSLALKKWDITPYINVFNEVPETGFSQFMDYPRYSTGYTTLWNTLGMMVETHMLKPYKPRVEGTYELMKSMIAIAAKDKKEIMEMRKLMKKNYTDGTLTGAYYPVAFKIDSSKTSTLNFKGFEGNTITSEITGLPRLKYDRSKPFNKEVAYYDNVQATDSVVIPKAYVIPQGWHDVISRLRENNIDLIRLLKDSTMAVSVYHIKDFETRKSPYEGHYSHYNTQLSTTQENVKLYEGDYLVETTQMGMRYLLETLEPTAVDSFFNWNFFDTILQQKEGFSPYVWEDKALELLRANPILKDSFESRKHKDKQFAANSYLQLDWIHKHSENYEKAHLRYPIFRIF